VSHISDEMAFQAALSEMRATDPALAYSVASTLDAILFTDDGVVGSKEYWSLECWTCRSKGHSSFTAIVSVSRSECGH